MKYGMITVLLLLWAMPAAAQAPGAPQDSLALSLQAAVTRVEEQSEEVRLARAQADAASAQVAVARSAALPQLSANLGYTRTFASIFTSGEGGGFGDLPFARPNSYALGLSASQVLFTGGRIGSAVDAARDAVRAAQAGLTRAEAQVTLQVRAAYYQALLARELVTIADTALQQAEQFLRQERLRFETGRASELAVLRAEVELENLRPQLVQARNAADLAELNLKRLSNIPLERPLRLTTQLAAPPPEALADPTLIPAVETAQEAALRAARSQMAVSEEQVDIQQSAYWPSVSVSTGYSQQLYAAELFDFGGPWQPNWTAGISISIPIFQGLERKAQVNRAQAQLSTARLQLAQLEEAVRLQYRQALSEKQRAAALIQARQRTVDQAQRVYDLTVLRYERGLATQLQVSDARLALLQARSNLAQALTTYYTAGTTLAGGRAGGAGGAGGGPLGQGAVPSAPAPQGAPGGAPASPLGSIPGLGGM